MNANDEDLDIEKIDNYKTDERYRDYLDRMPGAINRAISRFITYKVIPTKMIEVKPSQGETLKQFLKFNLKNIISDFSTIERIVYIHERVVPNIEFQTITDGIILIPFYSSYVFMGCVNALPENPNAGNAYNINGICKYWNGSDWEEIVEEETFGIEYTPSIPVLTANSKDDTQFNIPDALVRLIPYFVKGELYEQDEPAVAAVARNIFESALTEYISFGTTRKQRQNYVKNTMFE